MASSVIDVYVIDVQVYRAGGLIGGHFRDCYIDVVSLTHSGHLTSGPSLVALNIPKGCASNRPECPSLVYLLSDRDSTFRNIQLRTPLHASRVSACGLARSF